MKHHKHKTFCEWCHTPVTLSAVTEDIDVNQMVIVCSPKCGVMTRMFGVVYSDNSQAARKFYNKYVLEPQALLEKDDED